MLRLPFKLGRVGKANIGVGIATFCGIFGFIYAKRTVDQQRYDNMKIRQRMTDSNLGEYEPSQRYSK